MAAFRIKVDLFRRKSATKFLCVKTFSGEVDKHSLAYLTVHKGFVGDVPCIERNFLRIVVAAANASDAHKQQGNPTHILLVSQR